MKNLEGIQVGDRVWQRSMDRWGEVKEFEVNIKSGSILHVEFKNHGVIEYFTLDGKSHDHHHSPDLFFDKIPEPEYPKRPWYIDGKKVEVGARFYDQGRELEVTRVFSDTAYFIWSDFSTGDFMKRDSLFTCVLKSKKTKPIMLEGSPLKVGDVLYKKHENIEIDNKQESIDFSVSKIEADKVHLKYLFHGQTFADGFCQTIHLQDQFTRTKPKPKRKVKKTVECWANVYHDKDTGQCRHTFWSSKDKALSHAGRGAITILMEKEYELES